jgi:hypothetical protein
MPAPTPFPSPAANAAALALAIAAPSPSALALTLNEITGSWRVLSYEHKDAAGAMTHPLGKHPDGFLLVGSDHRCTLILAGEGRKPAANEEDYARLMKSHFAYSAPCTGEAEGERLKVTLRPDVASSPAMKGTKILRFLSLKGRELVVTGPLSPHGSFTARFERAR